MKVAILKLSSLGDVIHALPVAHALRRQFPDSHLTWVVEAREAALLNGHPDLDTVLPVDTRRWRRRFWTPAGAREIKEKLEQLRAGCFDVVLDLQGLLKSGLLTAYTGAPLRVGLAVGHLREPLNALFTNCRVTPPPQAVHVVEQYLALLEPLGVVDRRPTFNLAVNRDAEHRMGAFLAAHWVKPDDQLVALIPGARRPWKRWPVEHWRRLAERLALEGGCKVLVLWGPGENAVAEAVSRQLPAGPLLAPATALPELVALLRCVALAVAADTGPLHLAAALGTPCLGLYGPTFAKRNGPYGSHCRSLQSPDGAMASLQEGTVFSAATEMLSSRSPMATSAGPPGNEHTGAAQWSWLSSLGPERTT